ncbi:MAG: hypothetical protein IJ779_04235 [Ruminococcus sp.]|nr:hypothetical protein [Ruminococcus sp.]
MKKHLAICSILFAVCAAFTSCGDADHRSDVNNDNGIQVPTTEEEYESNYERHTTTGRHKDAEDYAEGVIDGVEDAGEDIVDGAGDAAKDVIDGLDGEKTDKRD